VFSCSAWVGCRCSMAADACGLAWRHWSSSSLFWRVTPTVPVQKLSWVRVGVCDEQHDPRHRSVWRAAPAPKRRWSRLTSVCCCCWSVLVFELFSPRPSACFPQSSVAALQSAGWTWWSTLLKLMQTLMHSQIQRIISHTPGEAKTFRKVTNKRATLEISSGLSVQLWPIFLKRRLRLKPPLLTVSANVASVVTVPLINRSNAAIISTAVQTYVSLKCV